MVFHVSHHMLKTRYCITFLILLSCFLLKAQEPKVIAFKDLQAMMDRNNDTTYVYNFWATWCKECVAELPNFEELNAKYQPQKVKVILISMDFKRELDTRLKPFIINRKIQSQVFLLNEPDYNSWIDKIDPSWGGSIPATIIMNKQQKVRHFFEKELTFAQLEEQIKSIINK